MVAFRLIRGVSCELGVTVLEHSCHKCHIQPYSLLPHPFVDLSGSHWLPFDGWFVPVYQAGTGLKSREKCKVKFYELADIPVDSVENADCDYYC